MRSTLAFCVLFQNDIAAQVYQVVVTTYSEEAIQAGMEYFLSDTSAGLRSWIHLLWKNSWKRPMPRGLGVQIWKRGCCKNGKIFPPVLSSDVRKSA